ncbi:MAG: D-glycero-beta-D-manno-heptose 1-phosphate adenylyltransferase [Bacteroidales bacterium]|nr:D-glycero-beta-D-manno-heptose 1-phosphate adenylyltransferase [Bacteroidales bacterium]
MNSLQRIKRKIVTVNEFKIQLDKRKKIAFTNGCFDLIHRGHIEYLAQASDYGDIFVIGLNTDASIHRLKGKSRPITDEKSRSMVLAALSFVDYVIFFDEDTPYSLIQQIQPDVLIKGSDYTIDTIVGADIVKAKGGQIITIDLIAGYSTSAIEKKIKESS